MNSLEEEKRRMKAKRHHNFYLTNNNQENNSNNRQYINRLIARLLISIIIFFAAVILTNFNKDVNWFISEKVLKDNISFTKISNFYNKYFGNIIPLQNIKPESETVFNEKMSYNSIKNYQDGYELTVNNNYLVPVIKSGIIVFIGEKEGLGNTVIIQGIDETDYWYSNVENLSSNLYDYVTEGSYLGVTKNDKLYLTFKKGNDYLEYDEVVQ